MKEYFKEAIKILNKNIIFIFILVLSLLVDYFLSNLILSKLAIVFIGTGSIVIIAMGFSFFAKIVSRENPLLFTKIFKDAFFICCRFFLFCLLVGGFVLVIIGTLWAVLFKAEISNSLYYLLHYLAVVVMLLCIAGIYVLPSVF